MAYQEKGRTYYEEEDIEFVEINRIIDLTGMIFGRLTVLGRAPKPETVKGKVPYWWCKCECGKIIKTSSSLLKNGKTKSCGCLMYEVRTGDHVGEEYGDFKVIRRTEEKSNGAFRQLVKCKKCGYEKKVIITQLRAGSGILCPVCNRQVKKIPQGELKIMKALAGLNISFVHQMTFEDCLNEKGNKRKFDFYLPDYKIVIEYNGEQHYKDVEYFQTTQEELSQIENEKNKYCQKHDIKLIIIHYSCKNLINEQFILNLIEKNKGGD